MIDPNNLADLALIKCFNATFIRKHLDWLQSSTDLSDLPGFQSHNMAVRFFCMQEDITRMFRSTFPGFDDYRTVVGNLDKPERDLQEKKEELFVTESQAALSKHFPRWMSPSLLPAALLSEYDTAVLVASIMAQDWNTMQYWAQDNQFFYSEVHGRRLVFKDLLYFICKFAHSSRPHSAPIDSPYTAEADEAAIAVINGCDLRYKELSSVDPTELPIRKYMFATYLPLPCQTQFVEFGVKEAQHVSQTNRSEEVRSAYGIIRSAHVTDAGNSKTGTTNKKMIINRINAARASADEHIQWKQDDPGYTEKHSNVLRLLRKGHFKAVRVDKKKLMMEETANINKRMNKAQKAQPQQLTAAVSGHVLYGKLTKKLHMDDLRLELVARNVPMEEIPDNVTARKKMLQDLEIQRLLEKEGLSQELANKIGKKQFAIISKACFYCAD